MQVILLERIEKLGSVGDVVTVKNGYARNFLLPKSKCLRATDDNIAYFEAEKAKIKAENEKKRQAAEALAKKLENVFVTILRQAGEDGRLFGSVASRDVSDAVSQLPKSDIVVDRSQVAIDRPIKYLGVYPLKIKMHPEVDATVNVIVARTEGEAAEEKNRFLNPTKESEKKEPSEDEELAEAVQADEAVSDSIDEDINA